MEAGAVFLLVVALIVISLIVGGLYGVATWLRHMTLDPERDKVEGAYEERTRRS